LWLRFLRQANTTKASIMIDELPVFCRHNIDTRTLSSGLAARRNSASPITGSSTGPCAATSPLISSSPSHKPQYSPLTAPRSSTAAPRPQTTRTDCWPPPASPRTSYPHPASSATHSSRPCKEKVSPPVRLPPIQTTPYSVCRSSNVCVNAISPRSFDETFLVHEQHTRVTSQPPLTLASLPRTNFLQSTSNCPPPPTTTPSPLQSNHCSNMNTTPPSEREKPPPLPSRVFLHVLCLGRVLRLRHLLAPSKMRCVDLHMDCFAGLRQRRSRSHTQQHDACATFLHGLQMRM
jgi:hypothetical protein